MWNLLLSLLYGKVGKEWIFVWLNKLFNFSHIVRQRRCRGRYKTGMTKGVLQFAYGLYRP